MISPTVTGFSAARELPASGKDIHTCSEFRRQEDAVEILSNTGTLFDLRR